MATFPDSVYAFVHPGIYMRKLSDKQRKVFDRQINPQNPFGLLQRLFDPTNTNPINLRNIGGNLPQGFQNKFFWTLEKALSEPYYRDRIHYSAALQFLKEIPKSLSEFTLNEFHSLLQNLHQKILGLLQRGDESPYRKEASGIFAKNNSFDKMLSELRKLPQEEQLSQLRIHERLSTETWDEIKKTLSKEEIQRVEGFFIPNPLPREIPRLIGQLHRDLVVKFRAQEDPLVIAGFAHMRLVEIHPFGDGNGRIARLLMNLILIQAGYSPIAFTSDADYTAALKKGEAAFTTLIKKTVAQFEYEEVVDLILEKEEKTFKRILEIAQQLLYPCRLRTLKRALSLRIS